jgi:hypothetical protein
VPYFLVGIRGNPDRAAVLLDAAGIQNVLAKDAPVEGDVAARPRATSAEAGIECVLAALEGDGFTVEDDARLEPG